MIECGYYNGAVMTRGAYILGTQKVIKSLLEAAEEGGYVHMPFSISQGH